MGVLCFGEHTFSKGGSGTLSSGRRDRKRLDYLSISVDQLKPYMASVFPTGNGIFQQDSVPWQKSKNVLEVLDEHKDEFRLIF
ncbi:uncharacterized protein TNCV_819021 [Trichonephila clavipes]|nr:uncharacterized protein TNCV_819021 [Trichonephila clavipes]